MSTIDRIQTLLRAVALLSVLAAGGALAYMFVAEGGPYGFLPVFVPLAITVVALLLDLAIAVVANVRTVSRGGRTEADIYLVKFRRSNFYIGLLFLLLGVVVLVVENGMLPWTVPSIIRNLLTIAVQVFGGLDAVLITAAVFGGIWYTLLQKSKEAVYAGMFIWGAGCPHRHRVPPPERHRGGPGHRWRPRRLLRCNVPQSHRAAVSGGSIRRDWCITTPWGGWRRRATGSPGDTAGEPDGTRPPTAPRTDVTGREWAWHAAHRSGQYPAGVHDTRSRGGDPPGRLIVP